MNNCSMNTGKGLHYLPGSGAFFWLGLLLMWRSGRYRRLCKAFPDLGGLLIGIIVGIFTYWATTTIVTRRLLGMKSFLWEVIKSLKHRLPSPRRLMVLGSRAVYEEALWRGTIQDILGNETGGVLWTALLFTLQHRYFHFKYRQRLPTLPLIELFLFALTLGILYRRTGRLMIVVAVHYVRNLLISSECTFPRNEVPTGRLES